MNLLQWEFDVLPTKVLKEDKAEYIQALIDTRENENLNVFLNCMARHHCQHLQTDIDQFIKSVASDMVDKQDLKQEMVDKWSIKPSLAEKMVDILGFVADKDQIATEEIVSHFGINPTTAKRYLRQLTEFGYLEAHGGNKNRTYTKKSEW
jgi:Fic family protein